MKFGTPTRASECNPGVAAPLPVLPAKMGSSEDAASLEGMNMIDVRQEIDVDNLQ